MTTHNLNNCLRMFKTVSSYFRKTFKTSQCQVVTFTLSLSLLRPCTSRPLHWSLATAFEVKMQPLSVSRDGTWMLCGCCIAGCSSGNSWNFLEGLPGSLVTLVTYSIFHDLAVRFHGSVPVNVHKARSFQGALPVGLRARKSGFLAS